MAKTLNLPTNTKIDSIKNLMILVRNSKNEVKLHSDNSDFDKAK